MKQNQSLRVSQTRRGDLYVDREEQINRRVEWIKGGERVEVRDRWQGGLFRCEPGCQMEWIIDVRERRIKRGEEEGRDGWIDDRDENMPLLFCFTTQLSIYLIFLVIKDLHRRAYLPGMKFGKTSRLEYRHQILGMWHFSKTVTYKLYALKIS